MRAFLLALLLAAAAVPAWAETNMCTVIQAAPAVISAPGTYCLEHDLAIDNVDGTQTGVRIQETSDVVLDCNGFAIYGSRFTGAQAADGGPNQGHVGVQIGSSKRVTVRNCVIDGYYRGIAVERGGMGLPRSVDVTLEDNRVDGAPIGILFISEGTGIVRRNVVSNSPHTAFSLFVPPTVGTRTLVQDNTFQRTGSLTHVAINNVQMGPPVQLQNGFQSAWLAFERNVIAESIAPPGTATPVLRIIDGGAALAVTDNTILAPADPGDAGSATIPVGGAGTTCLRNAFVGYGAGPVADCSDASNVSN